MANALLADGFIDLCFDVSLNALAGLRRVVVTGQQIDNTSTPDTLVSVQGSSARNIILLKFFYCDTDIL